MFCCIQAKPVLKNMKITFVTSNLGKYREVAAALEGIEVEHVKLEIPEIQSLNQREVVLDKALKAVELLKRPCVVEDTSLFFNAYKDFPGTFTKYIYQAIGFEGLFKLLDGKDRKAVFVTIAAFAQPGKEPVLFEGKLEGRIADSFTQARDKHLPFSQVFIPEGFDKTYWEIPSHQKTSPTHRAKAFLALSDYLLDKK